MTRIIVTNQAELASALITPTCLDQEDTTHD